MRFRRSVCFVFSCVSLAVTAADWPQWRGPLRTGHIPESSLKIDRLPERSREIWKIRIGEGFASPVLASNRLVYFDNQRGKETLHVLDTKSGNDNWAVSIDDTFTDQQGPPGPRCTPLIDGERIYAQSCKGELQCLDLSTGRLLWRANFVKDFNAVFVGEKGNIPGAARHGNNGSPVIAGDRLFACVGGTNGAGMVCFDKKSGAVIWKSQNDQAAYAPPIVAVVAGVEEMICFTVEGAVGLNAGNGALLWRVPLKTAFARHVTTPVVFEDMVVVASHEVGLVGIKVAKTTSGIAAGRAWLNKDAAMNFSSPVAVGPYLYGLGPRKNFVCVDIRTGQTVWSREGYLSSSSDRAHAAFLVSGEKVLALTDGGELVLFTADGAEFKEGGRLQVSGATWCNPAYADGILYVRDGLKGPGHLRAIDLTR